MGQVLTNFHKNILNEKDSANVDQMYVGDGKTPPVSRHVLPIDPRSPSQAIPRTPIEVEGSSVSMDLKRKFVRRANKTMNPFKEDTTSLPTFINGDMYSYNFVWGSRLSREQFDWILELSNENMKLFYENPCYEYDSNVQKQELRHSLSRYILVKNSDCTSVGYCRYRFAVEKSFAALECNEIQVCKVFQSKGIGSALLSILITLAKRASLDRITVKVFSPNVRALQFFHKHGFNTDTPGADEDTDQNFVVLVKYCI